MSRSWVDVDLAAIAANTKRLRARAPGAELCAVVKADGYGHGVIEVATAALGAGATRLGIAQVGEGVALREADIDVPIWVLSEPALDEFDAVVGHGLEPAIYSSAAIKAASQAAASAGASGGGTSEGGGVAVHLKIDTGMHRVGADPDDAVALAALIVDAPALRLGSVWTHLANADTDAPDPSPDSDLPVTGVSSVTDRQLDRYEATLARLADAGIAVPLRHAANSAGTIAHPRAHHDVVRCGIALYGLAPAPKLADAIELCPALSWRTTVGFVKRVVGGEAFSYGQRQAVDRDTTVATIPVGYADGFRRGLWETGSVLIGGKARPILGVVTMDQTIVDCGNDPVRPGDEVVLIGRQGDAGISADDLARSLGTINYEISTGIGSRVERRYVGP